MPSTISFFWQLVKRGGFVAFDVFGGVASICHQHAEVLDAVLAEGMSADNKPLDKCYKCQRRKENGLMIRRVPWLVDSLGSLGL